MFSILVLGDSYSAGNGAGNYYGAKGCWRSRSNYAEDYARLVEAPPYRQRATVMDAACSGATTSWFFNSVHGRPPELDAVNQGYDVIFLTVGGDDIQFAGIVQNCLVQILRDGRKCNTLLSTAEKTLGDGTLQGHIGNVLHGIRNRANPHAKIVLLGYPYIEGQENYRLPYDHGKYLDVPKRLRALEDLGDRVQQRAVDRLNARYHTHNLVFVKTKSLFAGHELYALSLNPKRWFIAPETDAGFAWRAWWYHPNPTGWAQEAKLLLQNPRVPKRAPGPLGKIRMSTDGHVGPLTLGVSTPSDVTALMGPADATANGQVSGYPPYHALGYQCGLNRRAVALVWDGNPPYCESAFFINSQTDRLEAVASQSDRFGGPAGIYVGQSASHAEQQLHVQAYSGCFTGFGIGNRHTAAKLFADVEGGRETMGVRVVGGHVSELDLDSSRDPIGLGFC